MSETTIWLDPACYWSWRTARWLDDAAEQRDLSIKIRPFSLKVLYGSDVNPDWKNMLDASHGALRVMERLRAQGADQSVKDFYVALGQSAHEQGSTISAETVAAAGRSVGLEAALSAFDDPAWDVLIEAETQRAIDLAGPEVGSPVVQIPGAPRGIFGPTLEVIPPQAEAGEIYDAVARLATAPYFYELKRGHA